jgi:hypothetical protein
MTIVLVQRLFATYLAYSKIGGCYLEVLIDDDLELPEKIPGAPKYEGIKRTSVSRNKRR